MAELVRAWLIAFLLSISRFKVISSGAVYREFVGDDFGFAPGDLVIESTDPSNPREGVISDIYDYGHYIVKRGGHSLLINHGKIGSSLVSR